MQLGILIRAIAYVPCNSIAVRRHCKKKKGKITTKRKLLRLVLRLVTCTWIYQCNISYFIHEWNKQQDIILYYPK